MDPAKDDADGEQPVLQVVSLQEYEAMNAAQANFVDYLLESW